VFVSREREIGRIDEMLRHVASGHSCVLLLEGEAGAGKTSLLELAAERADRMTVLRVTGVADAEQMAFAGLIGLLRPIAGLIDELPAPQQEALQVVLGLRAGSGGTRFLVGVALLGVLAAAGERTPVLVIVDDFQWLDVPTAQALLFALRRLQADRVGALLALRSGEQVPSGTSGQLRDLEVVPVAPLDARGAIELLSEEHVAESVAHELHRLTGGNPLALKETAATLTRGQRIGTTAISDAAVLPRTVRHAYDRQLDELPSRTRTAVLIAAAARLDDLDLLSRALRARDLDLADLADAEDVRLLRIRADVTPARYEWKHPLVRAAVLGAADPSGLRAAHASQAEALSEAIERFGENEALLSRVRTLRSTRAWHLASATVGTDDRVADELAAVAAEAAEGRAHSAAAAAYRRAATLTVDPSARVERLVLAAEAAWAAGDGAMTIELVEVGLEQATGVSLVRLIYLQGLYELESRSALEAVSSLENAFRLALPTDPWRAMDIVADLVSAAVYAGTPAADRSACECAALADTHADRRDRRQSALVTFAVHAARLLSFGAGVVRAVTEDELARAYEDCEMLAREDPARFTFFVLMNNMPGELSEAVADADPRLAILRARGELSALAEILPVRAFAAYWLGDWDGARGLATETVELARLARRSPTGGEALQLLGVIAAFRGDQAACVRHVAELRSFAEVVRGYVLALLRRPTALLALGLGRYEEAANRLDEVYTAVESCGRISMEPMEIIPDVVEALALSGRRDDAAARLRELVAIVEGDPDPRTGACVHRLHGLLARDRAEADAAFEEALRIHTGTPADSPFQRARTHLLYGERLRRDGQRRAAREQLGAAVTTFDRLGATPWARRANRELAATGASRRQQHRVVGSELTAQELRIAFLVAEGRSNKETAAEMYLSAKTIEFHLGHIFWKLDVRSRTQLAHRLTESRLASG
jgi:DNA-binding CsgD family transcriptional regulator